MTETFTKRHRAANDNDYESWEGGGMAPTLNAMDNTSDAFATVVIVDEQPAIGFNWQNGGGYGNANDGLGITEDGVGPLSTSQVPAVSVLGEVAHTLTNEGSDASEDGTRRGTPIVTSATYIVRRLTPVECERLQAWDDDHTRYGIDDQGREYELSDSQRYRQIGNGVTSTVAHYVAALIIHADRETRP